MVGTLTTKVLAINGSPSMEKGNTALILNPFLEGMKDAGATVELIHSKKLEIKPCIGDFQCWFQKVGVCIYSDDMQMVHSKIREADILVFATPIYLPLPGEFQNLLNRLMPIVEPVLETRDGRTRARFHEDVEVSKIVLVTSGGWWEKANSEVVVKIIEEIAENVGLPFIGPITRPHSSYLRQENEKVEEIFEAAKSAGHELVREGTISEDLLETISQPLIAEEEQLKRSNQAYENAAKSD